VLVNGQAWKAFDARSVTLPYDQTPAEAVVQIILGGAKAEPFVPHKPDPLALAPAPSFGDLPKSPQSEKLTALAARVAVLRDFHRRLVEAGLGRSYEAAHARLVVAYLATTVTRLKMVAAGKLPLLPATSQVAADQSYVETTARLCEGLEKTVVPRVRESTEAASLAALERVG
jgi:hypothetical protein